MTPLTKYATLPLFAATAGIVALGLAFPVERDPTETDPLTTARYACRSHLSDHLHDPNRAEWSGWTQWPASQTGESTYTVRADFRAPNAFGGIVRQIIHCDLRQDGDTWYLEQAREG